MSEIPTIDFSKLTLPVSQDREYDEKYIGTAIEHLLEIRNKSVDYVANPKDVTIEKRDDENWDLWVETPDGIQIFAPTDWAKQQTIGVTELPKRYHDTLIEKGHIDEAVNHMNMWLAEGNTHRIRTVGDQYRALVSPGYNPFDNYDAFVTIANTIKVENHIRGDDKKPIKFFKAQLSDHNMYVHIIDEGTEWDLGKKDTYKKMMVFKNSEVGDGAMIVEAGLWRSMCSNLTLHGVISRRIHKGEKLSEGIFAPDTMEAQNELWKKILRDSLNTGIASDQLFDEIIAQVTESKEIKIEPITYIEKLKKVEKLSDSEKDAIISAMMGDNTVAPEEKNTVFQVVNGITQASKGLGIERGRELNKIAGNISNLIKIAA